MEQNSVDVNVVLAHVENQRNSAMNESAKLLAYITELNEKYNDVSSKYNDVLSENANLLSEIEQLKREDSGHRILGGSVEKE